MSNEEEKKLEVIAGDGTEIDISPVYDHLNAVKPKTEDEKEKKEIVIPKTKQEREEENK